MFVCKQRSSQAIVSRLGLGECVPFHAKAVRKFLYENFLEKKLAHFIKSMEMTLLTEFTINDQLLSRELRLIPWRKIV